MAGRNDRFHIFTIRPRFMIPLYFIGGTNKEGARMNAAGENVLFSWETAFPLVTNRFFL